MGSKNKLVYPQVANYDDQILPLNQVQYDVFNLGNHFEHITLTNHTKLAQIGQYEIHCSQGAVVINDQMIATDRALTRFETLVIIKHDALTVVTTNLPQQPMTISDNEKANLKVSQPTLIVLTPELNITEGLIYRLELAEGIETVYFNGQPMTSLHTRFNIGDRLITAGISIERRPTQFKITAITGSYTLDQKTLLAEEFAPEYPLDFPDFRRSPRIMRQEPKDKVVINKPENISDNEKNDLFKTILPPLGMLTASFATAILSGRNPMMMLGMGSASLITMGISLSSYFTNKNEGSNKVANRDAQYQEYMIEKAAEVKRLADAQRQALDYHYPDMETLAKLVTTYSPRIYEKTSNNADYLKISLGTGRVETSFSLDFDYDEQQKNEPLVTAVQQNIVEPYQMLADAQITTSLAGQTIGLIGIYGSLKTAVQTLLLQVATFHSYHDVELLILVPEQNYEQDWRQWRWLPHFKMKELNLRGIVHNAQTRDMVLNSFYQLLNKRRQMVRENGKEKIEFSPHYVLTILDDSWLAGHGLNEFLAEDMSQYGVTVIWGKEDAAMLPETVTTMIAYDSEEAAELVNENNVYVAKEFRPYKLPTNYPVSRLISRLTNLNHLEVEKNAIPSAVTFLGMYNVSKIDELNIQQRWQVANTSKSLAVPLGLRGKDDLVYLNLHERAHGPHGLVAGTTGSGKSETVQSYLLSLAVNFAPEDVGFLPIDFKGGGMANLFAKLPHLLGSITNLDGAGSARALASIRAELQKRQRLFGQFGVNHINGYTKLYKAGKTVTDPTEKAKYPAKPLPHLFLVSDEFAELKANEPEFMAELVSTARIGRSLGVHLILATQKPSGVVDDQIWSNSRFKLALKVQDVADSNEILKTPDAASIVEPGRAYLQVGNNEIYELFQSAWSGAKYDPNQTNEEKIDERIWVINDYGQSDLLTTDLSDEDEVSTTSNEEEQTQLEALVDYIAAIAKHTQAVLPDKPWMPPLDKVIASPIIDFKENWEKERSISAPLGVLDIPSKQSQENFDFDIETQGNTLIYSSPGFGKTTALQTLLMNFAKRNTPEQMQFNLLDFGTNGLLPLKDLPHVSDIVSLDQQEKLMKMMQRIREQLEERKQAFQAVGVASLTQYEMSTQKHLPVILNVIDSYDAILEDKNRDLVDSVLSQVLREGNSLGIYLIMTTSRSSGIRMAMLSSIATQIPLFLIDDDELRGIMGRNYIQQQAYNGRGQLEVEDQVNAIQIYTPNQETESLNILQTIKDQVSEMDQHWQGNRPEKLPVVDSEFELATFNQDARINDWRQEGNIPLGLALADTAPVGFIPERHSFFLIVHNSDEQLESIREVLFSQFNQLRERYKTVLIDAEAELKENYSNFDRVITNNFEDVSELKQLMANYVVAANEERELEPMILYVSDLEQLFKTINFNIDDFKLSIQKGRKAGLSIIVQSPENYVGRSFDPYAPGIREMINAGMVMSKINDTNLIQASGTSLEAPLYENEAYYFESKGRKYTKMRFAGKK